MRKSSRSSFSQAKHNSSTKVTTCSPSTQKIPNHSTLKRLTPHAHHANFDWWNMMNIKACRVQKVCDYEHERRMKTKNPHHPPYESPENNFSRSSMLSSLGPSGDLGLTHMGLSLLESSIWFDKDSVFLCGITFSKFSRICCRSRCSRSCCSDSHWMVKRVTLGLSARMFRVICK